MKRALLILALAMAPLWAQENGNERIARIVHLKYADPASIRNLVGPFGVDVNPDPKLRVVTLSGHRANVDAAENAIKELDVPSAAPKDVDLTVYFIVGSDEPVGPPVAPSAPIPVELQSTVAALKQTFPFKNYSMLDALSTRVRAGAASNADGQLSGGRLTHFSVRSVSVEADSNIKLENLNAILRVPRTIDGKTNYMNSDVDSDLLDVKEGQKLVIGRSSLEGSGKALFLVLIARAAQ